MPMRGCAKTLKKAKQWLVSLAVAAIFSFAANSACAQQRPPVLQLKLTFKAADPKEKGDGTLSPAARAAITNGPLPFGKADVDAKAAANKASAEALKALKKAPAPSAPWGQHFLEEGLDDTGAPNDFRGATIVGAASFGRIPAPPDTTGAIGLERFIQLVNGRAGLYESGTGIIIKSETLDTLAQAPGAFNVDPQIIWDSTSFRFYYAMISVFSKSDNRLSFGFSKTPLVNDLSGDLSSDGWCHYSIGFGSSLPDFPKLGDSPDFALIGVNINDSPDVEFIGSALIAISKPPNGRVTCPPVLSLKLGAAFNLADSAGARVFTPVPANQIDSAPAGVVVARNGILPSTKLWFFKVTTDIFGNPIFEKAKGLTVPEYAMPPTAAQPGENPKLDTISAVMTQAVMAFNPRTQRNEFWTQHTIMNPNNPAFSAVRYYEIDPFHRSLFQFFHPLPFLLNTNFIFSTFAGGSSIFNGAISPDRVLLGEPGAFGNSFVLEYNRSGPNDPPEVRATSSVNGAPPSGFRGIVQLNSNSCSEKILPTGERGCRWGDYSGASPDPVPKLLGVTDSGVVWGTNQFSFGIPKDFDWGTIIFALKPSPNAVTSNTALSVGEQTSSSQQRKSR
jgi:hypothetical protein